MTVKELIAKLQALPNQDQLVTVNGYEGGYTDVDEIETIRLRLNVNTSWYYGPHESMWTDEDGEHVLAYNISR